MKNNKKLSQKSIRKKNIYRIQEFGSMGWFTSIIGTVGLNRRKRSRCLAVLTSTRAVVNAMHFNNSQENKREYI